MSNIVECDDCGKKYRVPEGYRDATLECRHCGFDIRIRQTQSQQAQPRHTQSRNSPPPRNPAPRLQNLQTWQIAAISSVAATIGFLLIDWMLPSSLWNTSASTVTASRSDESPTTTVNPGNNPTSQPVAQAVSANSANSHTTNLGNTSSTNSTRVPAPVDANTWQPTPWEPPPENTAVAVVPNHESPVVPPTQADVPMLAEAPLQKPPHRQLPPVPKTEWITVKKRFRIPVPSRSSSEEKIAVSGTPPHFVLHGRKLIDVRNDTTTKLPVELTSGKTFVSSDGRFVAHVSKDYGKADIIYVYSTATPDSPPARIEVEGGADVTTMKFLDASRFMAWSDSEWVIWDFNTNSIIDSFKTSRGDKSAVGPGGRWLAIPELNSMRVIDTASDLAPIQLADTYQGAKVSLLSCHALAFSPDLTELVAIFYPGKVVVWSMETREIIQLDVLTREPGQSTWIPNRIAWLPDKSGWLLNGTQLLDRKTMLVTWYVATDRFRSQKTIGMLLSQNQILMETGERDKRVLAVVEIPWEAIHDAMDKESAQLLRQSPLGPGKAISLRVDVQSTRFANNAAVQSAITEVVKKKMQSHDISIQPGQPISLVMKYTARDRDDHRSQNDDGRIRQTVVGS